MALIMTSNVGMITAYLEVAQADIIAVHMVILAIIYHKP